MIAGLIKSVGDIVAQVKDGKIKEDSLLIKLQELELELYKFEKTHEVNVANSPVLVAKEIADFRWTVDSCNKCKELKSKRVSEAIEEYKKIGSVKDQWERGERFIVQDADRELKDIRDGNIMVVCDEHKKIPTILRELYRVNK